MDAMNAVVSAINNVLWSYVLIVVLVGHGHLLHASTHLATRYVAEIAAAC